MGDLDLIVEGLFENWLRTIYKDEHGDHGFFHENIESSSIKMVKQAFFDGYKLGRDDKLHNNYQEQMQK